VTKKYLNALAADLAIDRLYVIGTGDPVAVEAFDLAVETLITGLKRANPRVDRDRFWDAVLAP
jgi:hypothetical protein